MTINQGMFSSGDSDRNTPKWLLEHLYEVFEFDLDPCSDKPHHRRPNVKAHFHYAQCGLEMIWHGIVYMNPPYGREIHKWMAKAASGEAQIVVCLIPARTDTRWWHDNIKKASSVTFIKGRLKFGDEENSAPFPSAIVVFGEISHGQRRHLARLGWEVTP